MPQTHSLRPIYAEVTKEIRVSVRPAPIEHQSNPEAAVFAFSYTVQIENLTAEEVQVLERHWKVYSGDQQTADIVGPGVVGQQPLIQAGEVFEYSSSAVIHDPVGAMEGSYTLRNKKGEFFEVAIPRFDLLYTPVFH